MANKEPKSVAPKLEETLHWQEVIDRLSKPSDSPASYSNRDLNTSFTGYVDCDVAIKLARDGWQEGLDKVKPLTARLFEKIGAKIETHDVIYDVEGASIDVARYLDGEPECWQQFQPRLIDGRGNRIIRIALNCCISSGVNTDAIMNKGAAIAALIECLELGGARVELTILSPFLPSGSRSAAIAYLINTIVKESDQPLDLARAIFALAHPAMLRCLMFASVDYIPKELQREIGSTYGAVMSYKHDLFDAYDIFIAPSFYQEPEWSSKEATEAWVITTLKEQGIEIAD